MTCIIVSDARERRKRMYLNILKKDLKRKKAMNIIVLLFIILSTMFVASGVNNIIKFTTALDDFFEMAKAPDYFMAAMNKNISVDIDEIMEQASSVDGYGTEKVLNLQNNNISINGEKIVSKFGPMLQSDMSLNYFLSDESILKKIEPGKIYVTESKANAIGIDVGDKITIELNGLSRDFVVADKLKDAIFGGSGISMYRYFISEEDFNYFLSAENTDTMYGSTLVYVYSSDVDKMKSEIKDLVNCNNLEADRNLLTQTYLMDMVVVGILLVMSVILIIIAFVVLRFTIGFTISEEFREIGVMKAIGIRNFKIRRMYIVKYLGLSIVGAAIGLGLSYPFGEMLRDISSQAIIMGNQNVTLINIICAIVVIAVIILFCYGCTGKVKKMTPIDAIRSGQTGERFRKKSLMNLGKSKLPMTSYLAANDITSSPKRFGIITLAFFLCLSIVLVLSITVSTIDSGSLSGSFGWAKCDIYVDRHMSKEYMIEGGREKLENHLDEMERILAENGMSAECYQEIYFTLTVSFKDKESNMQVLQGVGTTMDMYEYTAGSAPQNTNEIAITRNAAELLGANIGDTIKIKTFDGDKEYIITAFFQGMNNLGVMLRLHSDEYINYHQAVGALESQVTFTDNPDSKEIEQRMEEIRKIFPEYGEVTSCVEKLAQLMGVAETLEAVKILMIIITVIILALVTVLMERSFIAKEKSEIALMKAVGTRNGKIYTYHMLRFLFVGIIAIIFGLIFAMPLTHLCMDPIFKMVGLELAVNYEINAIEAFVVLPVIVLGTTIVSAFLTSLYTRKIKSSDTASIE